MLILLVIEYIFTINLFRDINANTIYYKLGQTWTQLTGTDTTIALFYRQKEYVSKKKRVRHRLPT
jgi:hypothetical protein